MLLMAITQAEFPFNVLMCWYGFGEWPMHVLGYSASELSSGGDFMRLPSDASLTGVLTFHTAIGLLCWSGLILIRRMLDKPLWS